jgi:putative copper export protein
MAMNFWILALSYWIHLLATIVWLGGLALLALVALPALRQGSLATNQWAALQRRFTPWVNASLVLLLVTGFVQMTNDPNYEGFLAVSTLWSQAILVKHIAVGAMMGIGAYTQWRLHPAMERLVVLAEKRPEMAEVETEQLMRQERRLLWVNLAFAVGVLFFTAIATAV